MDRGRHVCIPWFRNDTQQVGILCWQSSLWEERSSPPVCPISNFSGKGPFGSYPSLPSHSGSKATPSNITIQPWKMPGLTGTSFSVSMWQKRTFPCFVPFSPTGDNKSISTGVKLMKTATRPACTISVLQSISLIKKCSQEHIGKSWCHNNDHPQFLLLQNGDNFHGKLGEYRRKHTINTKL